MVIKYTGSDADTSCQPPYPYTGSPTTIPNGGIPTPVLGSENENTVTCYSPTSVSFSRDSAGDRWAIKTGAGASCNTTPNTDPAPSGVYTCTITDQ